MKIITDYDYAAWPVGGYYAYDEDSYDGPESHCPFGWGKTTSDAIEELAAQWASTTRYEDFTTDDLDRWHDEATARHDTDTLNFVARLRVFT